MVLKFVKPRIKQYKRQNSFELVLEAVMGLLSMRRFDKYFSSLSLLSQE